MARTRFQVLIIPYRIGNDGTPEYAVTKRSDIDAWQFFFREVGKIMKHPLKQPDGRPTKRVVFQAI